MILMANNEEDFEGKSEAELVGGFLQNVCKLVEILCSGRDLRFSFVWR